MTITVYTPGRCGKINGGALNAAGRTPIVGTAACGPAYPLGTRFEIVDEDALDALARYSLPAIYECADRGGWVGNKSLDLVFNLDHSCAEARAFGKRKGVRVNVLPDRVNRLDADR